MTLEEFVTHMERNRVEPEEELRFVGGDVTTEQEIVCMNRMKDEDGKWYVEIELENP